jgi:TolB-like protein
VRLSLHLVDAATDSNVWSRTFDRQLRDALSLNDDKHFDTDRRSGRRRLHLLRE